METNKILTVAVPTYNMERYLGRCLDSLILPKELMERLEVLVVNDGSKDKSSQIAHEYENRFPLTFRVIDKQNGNYGSCVNRALDEAKGKYFRILDADDRFNPETFPIFIQELSKADADMVLTHFCYISDCDEKKRTFLKKPENIEYGRLYKADEFSFSKDNREYLLSMHSITYKLDILRKVGLRHQTGISYTDTEYVYFPLVATKTILPIDLYLYLYTREREGQTMSVKAKVKSLDAYYKVAHRLFLDYVACNENKSDFSLRDKQLLILFKIVYGYYNINLLYTERNEEDNRMRQFYQEIKDNCPELLVLLRKETVRKVIYVFRIWERSGKYLTDQPYKSIYKFLTTLKGKSNKPITE